LGTVPVVTPAPLLLAPVLVKSVPVQVTDSPVAAWSASPRNPITVVIQSPLSVLLLLPERLGVEE
jgi:hypothetical protein